MLPPAIDLLTRLLGIVTTLLLTFSPWFLATESEDPFLNQGWLAFGLGIMAVTILGLVLPLFRPRRRQIPMLLPGLFAWSILVVSTLQSPFFVSLRTALLMATQLLLLFFLRLTRRSRDSLFLTTVIALNGTAMAIYCLFQAGGWDFIRWVDSPHQVVGTFSNPNFLAAYLMVTALVTLGLLFHERFSPILPKVIFSLALVVQLAALSRTHCAGAWLCLLAGGSLMVFRFWEVLPGSFFRRTPFVGGLALTFFLVGGYGLIGVATRNYPWETLSGPPFGYFPVITRLLEWQMGFSAFLNHPLFGLGPGGLPYVLAGFRPPLGTVLGLSSFNDDPHSHVLLLLGETGILGLLGFCALGAAFLGVHARFRHHLPPSGPDGSAENAPTMDPAAHNPIRGDGSGPSPDGTAPAGSGPSSGTSPAPPATGEGAPDPTGEGWLAKVLAAAILALACHGLFNNTLSILPLTNLLVLLVSLHQSLCLRDISWRRGFSLPALGYLCFPLIYGLSAWTLHANHQDTMRGLYQGRALLDANQPLEAEASFEGVLKANPQSLFGIWGLAQAMEKQGRLARVQDLLGRLDNLGPNVLGVKLHLSRILFERNMILEAHRYAIKNLAWSQSPMTYELLGRILITEGRIDEAEQILREGLLLIPLWPEEERQATSRIRLQLASIEVNQGRLAEARQQLDQLIPPETTSEEFFYLRGLLEYKNRNATESLGFFEQALARNASEPRYLNAVGYLLVELNGDLERAERLLEEAYREFRSRTSPLLSDILNTAHSLGKLYWRMGKHDKAQELLTIAFTKCPLDWREIREERSRDLQAFFRETGRKLPPDGETASGTP